MAATGLSETQGTRSWGPSCGRPLIVRRPSSSSGARPAVVLDSPHQRLPGLQPRPSRRKQKRNHTTLCFENDPSARWARFLHLVGRCRQVDDFSFHSYVSPSCRRFFVALRRSPETEWDPSQTTPSLSSSKCSGSVARGAIATCYSSSISSSSGPVFLNLRCSW